MTKKELQLILLGLTLFNLPAMAALSGVDLESVVAKSGVLPAGTKVSALVQGNEILLSTISRSTNDNDLKIEAVLLARKIFEADPSLVRVSLHYFDILPTTYKKITVSIADVKAYSAGLTDQNELLQSLVVTQETDNRFAKPDSSRESGTAAGQEKDKNKIGGTSGGGSDTKSGSDAAGTGATVPKDQPAPKNQSDQTGAKDPNEIASAFGDKNNSIKSVEKNPYATVTIKGLTLYYPSIWSAEYPDKDVGDHAILKLVLRHSEYVELKYYDKAESPKAVLDSSYKSHAKRDENHQKVNVPLMIRFGVGKACTGVQVAFYHTKTTKVEGTEAIFERHVSFGWPNRVYKLKCRANRANAGAFNAEFEKLLNSITLLGVKVPATAPKASGSGGKAASSVPIKKNTQSTKSSAPGKK